MIAVIADIVASRDVKAQERRKFNKKIQDLLKQVYERFKDKCVALPALTQGDSIELLVTSWEPIVFLFHKLLLENLEFRVGFGTGEIIIQKPNSDDCDGPAFWNAREALNEIKGMKYMNKSAGFRFDDKTSEDERNAVVNAVLIHAVLLGLSSAQLKYCFYYIWEKKSITEIATVTRTSKGNVSKVLGKTPCYLLGEIMTFLRN
jgi:hypothetical protein